MTAVGGGATGPDNIRVLVPAVWRDFYLMEPVRSQSGNLAVALTAAAAALARVAAGTALDHALELDAGELAAPERWGAV